MINILLKTAILIIVKNMTHSQVVYTFGHF